MENNSNAQTKRKVHAAVITEWTNDLYSMSHNVLTIRFILNYFMPLQLLKKLKEKVGNSKLFCIDFFRKWKMNSDSYYFITVPV
jgi:hypothetical protein